VLASTKDRASHFERVERTPIISGHCFVGTGRSSGIWQKSHVRQEKKTVYGEDGKKARIGIRMRWRGNLMEALEKS